MMSRRAESGTLPGTYSELKRGRKPCSSCDVIIGAGRKKCPVCAAVFGAKSKASTPTAGPSAKSVPVLAGSCRAGRTVRDVTVIPSGKCPIELTSTKVDDVIAWAATVAAHWRYSKNSTALSLEAVAWWARGFFPFKSPEHSEVCAILRDRLGVTAS
jgi:hypothetical protein